MSLHPYDPEDEVTRYRRNLPHWRQDRTTYFITFRLADSLPAGKLAEWRHERERWFIANGYPDGEFRDLLAELQRGYYRRFTDPFLYWLDEGYGSCRLRRPDAALIVANTLQHFDGEKYALGAWVIMPNHVHILVSPNEGQALSLIVKNWKSFSAKAINQLDGKTGAFWQAEFYDHIVRNEEQLRKLEAYIAANPLKAKLRQGEYLLSTA